MTDSLFYVPWNYYPKHDHSLDGDFHTYAVDAVANRIWYQPYLRELLLIPNADDSKTP